MIFIIDLSDLSIIVVICVCMRKIVLFLMGVLMKVWYGGFNYKDVLVLLRLD